MGSKQLRSPSSHNFLQTSLPNDSARRAEVGSSIRGPTLQLHHRGGSQPRRAAASIHLSFTRLQLALHFLPQATRCPLSICLLFFRRPLAYRNSPSFNLQAQLTFHLTHSIGPFIFPQHLTLTLFLWPRPLLLQR